MLEYGVDVIVLIVDDDVRSAARIREELETADWAPYRLSFVYAYSINEALRASSVIAGKARVIAFVDLVLPETDEDRDAVEQLEGLRQSVPPGFFKEVVIGSDEWETEKKRRCMLDRAIAKRVDCIGGLKFLERVGERAEDWAVVIHSAAPFTEQSSPFSGALVLSKRCGEGALFDTFKQCLLKVASATS